MLMRLEWPPRWDMDKVIPNVLAGLATVAAIVAVAMVVGSWWQWNHSPLPQVMLPPSQAAAALSTTPSSAPAAATLTATSIPESAIDGVGSEPSSGQTEPSQPSTPERQVIFRVFSETDATIRYTSVSGRSWPYKMGAGRWQITAPAGGRILVQSTSSRGSVRCETADKKSGKTLLEDSSFTGSVECRSLV